MEKLYRKYNITKTNGKPIDPDAQYFVLRIDTRPAARVALLVYAEQVEKDGEVEFACELRQWVEKFQEGSLKPIVARWNTNIDCPGCIGLLTRSEQNHYHIFCHNPDCELYGILFEQPSVELKLVKDGLAEEIMSQAGEGCVGVLRFTPLRQPQKLGR